MPSTTTDPVSTPATGRPGWLSWSVAVLFGLFFAYDVFEAVGNLVGIVGTASGLAVPVLPLGWVVLIGGLLLPIVAFAIDHAAVEEEFAHDLTLAGGGGPPHPGFPSGSRLC